MTRSALRDPLLLDLLAIVWHQRVLVTGVVVVTVSAVAILSAVTPRTFLLSSAVEVQRGTSDSTDPIDDLIARTNNGSLVNALLPPTLGRGLDIRADFRQPMTLELSTRTTDAERGRRALKFYTDAVVADLARADERRRARLLEEVRRNESVLQNTRAIRQQLSSVLNVLRRDRVGLTSASRTQATVESHDHSTGQASALQTQLQELDIRIARLAGLITTELDMTMRLLSDDTDRLRQDLGRLGAARIVKDIEVSGTIEPRLYFKLVAAFIAGALIGAVVAFLRESCGWRPAAAPRA